PLRCGCSRHGWMYLFGTMAQLTDTRVAAGELVAAVLGAATGNAIMSRQCTALAVRLSTAVDSRIPIEQAKGLLAERFRVSLDAAFQMLQAHSRRTRTPMTRAAQAILDGNTILMPAQP